MKFNKKYTTIAFYACIVIFFTVVCIYLLLSVDKGRFESLGSSFGSIINKIFIGAIVAYILNPIVNFFEDWIFIDRATRQKVCRMQKEAKQKNAKMPFTALFDLADKECRAARKERYLTKLSAYEACPTKKIGKYTIKRKPPKQKEHPFRGLSVLCTVAIVIVALGAMVWIVAPQLEQTLIDLYGLIKGINPSEIISRISGDEHLSKIYNSVNGIIDLEELLNRIKDFAISFLTDIPNYIFSFISSVYQTVYDWLIGIIFAIYFLIYKDLLAGQFRNLINSFLPNRGKYWLQFIVQNIDSKFGKFIEGKIVDSLIIGILSFFVFTIFKLPYAAMIALIVGVTNVIPFFGPIIGAVPCALILLISAPSKVILFILLIILIQQLDGNLIGPFILGDSMELPPVWIMIAIITMGGLFGFFGMFFGVPIFAVIFTLIKELASIARQKKAAKAAAGQTVADPNADPFTTHLNVILSTKESETSDSSSEGTTSKPSDAEASKDRNEKLS